MLNISNILDTVLEEIPEESNNQISSDQQQQQHQFQQQHLGQNTPSPNSDIYGSFQCAKFKSGKRCDLCKHMVETSYVKSKYFNTKIRIHGHLAHDIIPLNMHRWFIYSITDEKCGRTYIGSTTDPLKRWRNHKSSCNNGPCTSSGLSKHFTFNGGCPNDPGREKETLVFTLVDYMDVSPEALVRAGHEGGAKCRCSECNRLKDLEDKFILKMGTFYGDYGSLKVSNFNN